MKEEYFLYLVDNEMKLLTRSEAIAIKLTNSEKEVWNAFDSLEIEPVLMDT